MPLLGGLFNKGDGGPVVIPVAGHVPIAFRVYYTPGYPPLAPDDLRVNAGEWLDRYVEEPLRSALRPVVGSEKLSYTDMAKTSFPPPLEVLQKEDVGAEERSRFEAAWQVAVVSCEARTQVPMLGLWAAVAAGRSAALSLKGALFDAVAVRLTSIASYQQPIPGMGVLRAADHLAVGSSGAGGPVSWRTAGMPKFGLPDLELLDAPAEPEPPALARGGRPAAARRPRSRPTMAARSRSISLRSAPGSASRFPAVRPRSGSSTWPARASAPP